MARAVELDEGEYNQLVALRGIAQKIVGKPEARRLLEQAHKLVDPNVPTPTLDADRSQNEPIVALQKKYDDEIAALRKERDDEKRDATLASIAQKQAEGIARLKRERWTDEGVAAVQKLMETKGLLDVDDAVAIFERNNPTPIPATPGGGVGGAWNFTDIQGEADKSIKDLIDSKGQNDQIADRMAGQALTEFRQSMGLRH
jgi:hypothetical protein